MQPIVEFVILMDNPMSDIIVNGIQNPGGEGVGVHIHGGYGLIQENHSLIDDALVVLIAGWWTRYVIVVHLEVDTYK